MNEIQLKLNETSHGAFVIEKEGRRLAEMVSYARKNQLKVIPLCPFVHGQFKRHPDEYQDIWNKSWHEK